MTDTDSTIMLTASSTLRWRSSPSWVSGCTGTVDRWSHILALRQMDGTFALPDYTAPSEVRHESLRSAAAGLFE